MKQFNSDTFVCFIDIAGFKVALAENINLAGRMLDVFYSAGFNVLKESKSLNGIFISDCGIIYSTKGNINERLENVLLAIKQINKIMLTENYLTTTSIAYGFMEYRKKFVFSRMTKNAIVGSGYLNAFQDNEDKINKLNPGEVRITKKIINPNPLKDTFKKINFKNGELNYLIAKDTHYYYNWNCENKNEINNTVVIYENYLKDQTTSKHERLKSALRNL